MELTKKNWSSSRGKNKRGPIQKGGLREGGGGVGGWGGLTRNLKHNAEGIY